jgi:hypothetical protein
MVINAYVLAAEPAWIEASIASYYDLVETIVVSYDRSGRGWTGAPIPVDECLDRLRAVDPAGKMRFCPGDFARPDRSPLENDTYQRQCALEEAGRGADWVLAIDTDEVLPNAREFGRRLREEVPKEFPVVEWPMRPFFRVLGSGLFLEVCSFSRRQLSEYPGPIAVRPGVTLSAARHTHLPQVPRWRYEVRRTGYDPVGCIHYRAHGVIPKSEAILHFSWARTEDDMVAKLESWSHNKDFDWRRYFERVWKPATWRWPLMYNFHPVWSRRWPALRPVYLPQYRASDPGAPAGAAIRHEAAESR